MNERLTFPNPPTPRTFMQFASGLREVQQIIYPLFPKCGLNTLPCNTTPFRKKRKDILPFILSVLLIKRQPSGIWEEKKRNNQAHWN